MARFTAAGLWETSLLGRLVTLAFLLWDNSLLGRGATALGRFAARVFAGSFAGRIWYSTWPSPAHGTGSLVAAITGRLSLTNMALARAVGPFLGGLWETSLLGGLYRAAARWLRPWLSTSLLVQAYAGFAGDVVLSPTEAGRRRTSPVVYLLGAVLGLIPLIPSDFRLGPVTLPSPTVMMMAGIWFSALVWYARKLVLRDHLWRASSALLPLAVFLLVAVAATVQSIHPMVSAANLLVWLTAGLLFWLVVNVVRNSRDAAILLGPVFAGAVLMAVWAAYQWVFPPVIEERWFDPATSGDIVRSFASLGNPNYLAEYMTLYLPLGVALWTIAPRRRLELTLVVAAMAVALLLTMSRGGWIAALLALGVLVLMRAGRWSPILFLGGALALLVAPPILIQRFLSAFNPVDTSNQYRLNMWTGVIEMVKVHWAIGVGLGAEAFNKVYQEFQLSEARAAHAHNSYLQVLAEMGVLGLLTVLWALLAVIRRTFVVGVNPRNTILIAAVPAALIGLLFHGLVEHIWYNPKLLFAFWAVAGLGMGLTLGDREDSSA